MLVDLERNRVLDLLPDCGAEGLASWVRAHPGIAVIARGRASAYADDARQGECEAVQLTARWHLLRNLGEEIHDLVERHHAAAQRAGRAVMAQLRAQATPAASESRLPNAAARPGRGGTHPPA